MTVIRNKITGNEVGAVAYYDTLKDDWRETAEVLTKYQLLDMKNGKLVMTSFDDAEAPNAKVKLGIDQDVEPLLESMAVKVGDNRIPLIKHVVFDKMADEFVEQSIAAVEKDEHAQ